MQEKFGAAAVLLKMADKQVRTADEARNLQERLARERLMARRTTAKNKVLVWEDVAMPESDDIIPLRVSSTFYLF